MASSFTSLKQDNVWLWIIADVWPCSLADNWWYAIVFFSVQTLCKTGFMLVPTQRERMAPTSQSMSLNFKSKMTFTNQSLLTHSWKKYSKLLVKPSSNIFLELVIYISWISKIYSHFYYETQPSCHSIFLWNTRCCRYFRVDSLLHQYPFPDPYFLCLSHPI